MVTRREGLRVLLVQAEPEGVEELRRQLGPGSVLTVARSATEALALCDNERFDVLLVDADLEGLDAADLLSRCRSRLPAAQRVVHSGDSAPPELLPAIDRGDIHRFLKRPFTAADVLRAARRFLRETHPARVLVQVVDRDEQRAGELARLANAHGTMMAFPFPRLDPTGHPGAVLFVEPQSPGDVEDAIDALGGPTRKAAILVALSIDHAIDAPGYLAVGADDVIWLPLRPEELFLRYRMWRMKRSSREEAERIRTEALARSPLPAIVGQSDAMQRVFHWVHRVAATDSTVLLRGETGTGKELIARALHALSPRRDKPFLAVNLSALPETLIESELFGHEPGAFTGATGRRKGRFDAVEGGTLFLDEIGDVPQSLQVKLLRVLEERRFTRVGSTEPHEVDFRLVCATHRDLEAMVAGGAFRQDLYYRIHVVPIDLPPLRARRDDIVRLAHHFLERFAKRAGVKGLRLEEAALDALVRHDWPGNVRELEHILERAVAMSREGDRIGPELIRPRPARASFKATVEGFLGENRGLREVLDDVERTILVDTLRLYDGNKVAAARKLKIPRQTLQNRLRRLGLD